MTRNDPRDGAAPQRSRQENINRLDRGIADSEASEVHRPVKIVELPREGQPGLLIEWWRNIHTRDDEPISVQMLKELPEEHWKIEGVLLGEDMNPQRRSTHVRSVSTRAHVTDA